MKLADAHSFIAALNACASATDVGRSFGAAIAPSGFSMVSCGASRQTPSGWTWQFFFNSWPEEWLIEYRDNDYVRYDLMPTMARISAVPFTWLEVLSGRVETPKQRAFHARVRELGVADGFAVPIHLPAGDVGLCVSVSTHPIADREERLALHLASLYAFQRCLELGSDAIEASTMKNPLSPREIECLRWVLEGKSDTDIGKILGISPTTVHFHVERVKGKLGVRTRTQAAATVMTLGYL